MNKEDKKQDKNKEKKEEKLREEIADLREKLKDSQKTCEDYLDQLKRLKAEYENYTKRMEKKAESSREEGMKKLASDLLVILDNFERALTAEKVDSEGVDLIYREFRNILKKKGLKRMEIKDNNFDHNLHHAIGFKESDQEEGNIAEVIQPGYYWKEELLRPAMVLISKKEGEEDKNS